MKEVDVLGSRFIAFCGTAVDGRVCWVNFCCDEGDRDVVVHHVPVRHGCESYEEPNRCKGDDWRERFPVADIFDLRKSLADEASSTTCEVTIFVGFRSICPPRAHDRSSWGNILKSNHSPAVELAKVLHFLIAALLPFCGISVFAHFTPIGGLGCIRVGAS